MEMVKDASDINSLKENDPLLTLYAGGCGRAIVMFCAFIGAIFCALMWKRRKMKMNCSNRAI